MKRLGTLSPIPRYDTQITRDLFPTEAKEHSGKIRVSLITDLLCRYVDEISAIADPLIGVGSICAGVQPFGVKIFGCEYNPTWVECAREVARKTNCDATIWQGNSLERPPTLMQLYDAILTSPPFPNAHTQGNTKMQQGMRAQKSTFAGNNFDLDELWGCGSKPDRKKWIATLTRLLDEWTWSIRPGGPVLIHIKDYVRGGKIVDVGEWVAEAFDRVEIFLEGDWIAKLSNPSNFITWKRYHQRKILKWVDDVTVDLECGHTMVYDKPPVVPPKKKVCTGDGCKKENHVEVVHERVIVGRMPA